MRRFAEHLGFRRPRPRGVFRVRHTGSLFRRDVLVTDDAGRAVPLFVPGQNSIEERVRRERLERAAARGPAQRFWTRVKAWAAFLPALLWTGFIAHGAVRSGDWSPLITLAVVVVGATILGTLVHPFTVSRRAAAAAIADALRRTRCPCCDYDLTALSCPREAEATSDAIPPCPECGAAWLAAKWLRAFPDHGRAPPTKFRHTFRAIDDRQVMVDRARLPFRQRRAVQDRVAERFFSWLGWRDTGTLAVVAVFSAILVRASSGLTPIPMLLIGSVLLMPPVLLYRFMSALTIGRREAFALDVSEHRCPACTGPLRMECSLVDGCRLCDACGAAWRDT